VRVLEKFIYCFDEETREKLEKQGYKLIKPVSIGETQGYMFENMNNKNMNFDLGRVMFSSRMNF
jgi:hypothetical protein